ncbi:murein hydrolase activator EnvC family protein [Cellulomonas composti]|uniref:M23ase beta-sheet core domain-containing protein n=1 Tax=Cellulomonas composti TaxID=266130 RepID=A0A511J8N1_9CELL|nr:M23 family metallopeptidase [Cellulomonas composti]GEL94356.1 hypothetical protein CCO02nite_10140 [Cellulomonas composti]
MRASAVVVLLAATLALAAPATVLASPSKPAPVTTAPASSSGYIAPVDPWELVHPFVPPPRPWAPGHRGVDLRADVGQAVRAPGTGTVTFAGTVAGRGVLSIALGDGVITSLEPVVAGVAAGERVVAGQSVGVVGATSGHCAPATCLHWGVRTSPQTYIDPLTLLGLGPIVLLG